ncbi:hypothetical protein MUCCIDRAFT_106596 [Mucor lusitanicus CBS 277.49]|uniref:Uncharacterized protein n=1 Tax=Mucor lusitanicus CBS 277.49 TaxID=747725 RepID=A0A168NAY0_MUCCL|nr:hypothetical protein MUCCIDRAFT_106596 [Mucor lusitanicus CBS 277.49]
MSPSLSQSLSTTDAEQDIELPGSDNSDLESVVDEEIQDEEEENHDISSEYIKKQLYPDIETRFHPPL